MSIDSSQEILSNILGVLQGIEKKLDQYEGRLRLLERTEERGNAASASTLDDTTERAACADTTVLTSKDAGKSDPKIYYSEWHTNHLIESLPRKQYNQWDTFRTNLDDFLDLRLSKAIEARLGDCWNLPDDGRIPLKFFKSNILKSNVIWGLGAPKRTLYQTKQPFELELDFLCRYDEEHRKQKGNDFVVVDFDAHNISRLYRVGEKACGK